jgi:pantoate--beta-alanine ligase
MSSSSNLKIIKPIGKMQEMSEQLRHEGKKIAFVATMGYLHKGHTSLIERARSLADVVITSIFVNPIQFGPNEDFSRYPRDFDHDQAVAKEVGTDIIFYPDAEEIFPKGFDSYVEVEGVSKVLEGVFRPGHFRGVSTVVTKLFNIVKPHIAIFGQKDAQQVFVIKKIVRELNFDIDIVITPIIREEDGLALSSRNIYLGDIERKNASVLFLSLQHAVKLIRDGERSAAVLKKGMHLILQSGSPTQIDYIAFVDPSTFTEVVRFEIPEVLVLLAVRFGSTRLIDNILIPITL